MNNEIIEERVPVKSKFWLSFADGCVGTLNGLVTGGGLSYFFTKYMGLSEGLDSIVWIIFAIWNAFNDPIFGYLSDKTKSKLGRRIPYIRYGSIIYAAVFILCWVKYPFGESQIAMFFQMLVSLFLFDTLYTAIATSLYVMPYEMAVSNKARSKIFIWKIIFGLFSLVAPLIILPMIKPEVGESATKFQIIMAALGVLVFLVVFISTFFYKEKGYVKEQEQMPIFKSIGYCFKNKAFLVFEVISITVIFVQTILMQGVIYYFDEFNVQMYLCYSLMFFGAIFGMIFFLSQREKLGVKKCTLIMCVVFAIGTLVMTAFGGNVVAACVGFFAVGVGFSGGMYLVPIINGDVIDYDESQTGLRREGVYAGVNSFITKPAISLANAAFLMILKWFSYDQTLPAGFQNELAKTGVLVAWMAIPTILLVICLICMRFYPLDGEEWNKTKRQLEENHKKLEEEYEQKVLRGEQND